MYNDKDNPLYQINHTPNYISNNLSNIPFRRKHHPWLATLFIGCVSILSLGMALGRNAYHQAQMSYEPTYQRTATHDTRDASTILNERKPVSLLLMGTDTGALGRHDKRGRTDTMILATINAQKQQVSLTSIPRDTKVGNIKNDQNNPDKINNAYTIDGANGAIDTVQGLLHVPIDYYAVINMGGLEKMVNSVGGVTVHPNLTFKYGACNVTKGKAQHLNGIEALDYCRMRHQDPHGDYGRQTRQREVIKDLVMKGLQTSSLFRYKDILSSLHGNLLTNISFNDMMAMRWKYAHATRHLQSNHLAETGEMDNGVSYQVPDKSQIDKITQQTKENLSV